MTLVVADVVRAPSLPITGDSVPHFLEVSLRFDVDMEQIAKPLPLVARLGVWAPDFAAASVRGC
jgi:hypothetical protein